MRFKREHNGRLFNSLRVVAESPRELDLLNKLEETFKKGGTIHVQSEDGDCSFVERFRVRACVRIPHLHNQ